MSKLTSEERLQQFLVSHCFQRPPEHAVDLAKSAWGEQEIKIKALEAQIADKNAEIARLKAENGTCDWVSDDDCWETSCGAAITLIDGTPQDNEMEFCHKCGKPITLPKESE